MNNHTTLRLAATAVSLALAVPLVSVQTSGATPTHPSPSSTSNKQDTSLERKDAPKKTTTPREEKTHIEYRSEADRLAFEKLGQYIHTSEDGTVSAIIPEGVRRNNNDDVKRVDEFVEIVNMAHDDGKTPTITTYGNETKIEGWGPIQRVYISHDTLSKVNKVLGAGGGVAGVAAILASEAIAGPAGGVAAGLTALIAAGNLCDWNDHGIIIWKVPRLPTPACTPQK